jgi:hypothetical protein
LSKTKRALNISRLQSGGLITNYYCTSRCGHCLYSCSPKWKKAYIDRQTTEQNFKAIQSLGCRSVHIGGGEPFLDVHGLKRVLEAAREVHMNIDYVETNSSWFSDQESAVNLLEELGGLGLSTLLVSISPFHNQYIPFYKVKGVIAACRLAGMSIFPWINDFYPEIDAFDDRTTHSLDEYRTRYGEDYLAGIPSRYWVHLGGRALETFGNEFPGQDSHDLLAANPKGCDELLDTSHFHLDLFGNYVPGLCAGLAIDREDLGRPLSEDRYPFLTGLYTHGIRALYDIATQDYAYKTSGSFLSKCHLCFDIRHYLATQVRLNTRDLQPLGCYTHV